MFENYETPVQCEQGHLYTSTWVPVASLKAIRLGSVYRFQRCPVGHHWSRTRRLDPAGLSPQERMLAAEVHDAHIP